MGKFIVEVGVFIGGVQGIDKYERVVDAESRIDAEIAVLASHFHNGPRIVRLRAFPARLDEKGELVKVEQTCGTCGWLHDASPQFTSPLYDSQRGQGWCWAVPSHVHRSAKLPACAHWKPKEE